MLNSVWLPVVSFVPSVQISPSSPSRGTESAEGLQRGQRGVAGTGTGTIPTNSVLTTEGDVGFARAGGHMSHPFQTGRGTGTDLSVSGSRLLIPRGVGVTTGEIPVANPGCRFCHVAVSYEGCLYSFGGYDGSHR